MSSAAKSAVATVPLERSIEALERRLIELRADIDAILTQLASHKTATPAIELAGAAEPQAPEAIAEEEPAPAATAQPSPDLPAQAEVTSEPSISSDEMDQRAGATQMDAIASDQPSAVAPPSEAARELPSNKTLASDDLTPIDAIDQTMAVADTRLQATAETVAPPQAEMQIEPASEAAMPIAPAASVEPTSAQPASTEPTAAAAPECAAGDVPASTTVSLEKPAAAQVISLQPRQRKQKAGFSADTSAPIRPRRRLATKIAASIIALLAAATMLMVADKAALGSAQSLPWMSPLPSYVPSGASWPFLGLGQAAGQGSTAADSSTSPAPAAADDALLLRYREAWPTSW